jgi:hypothetical protein
LQHKRGAVRHADEAHFLARFGLAMGGAAIRRHVRYLADEARGAGLPAGVGIHLRVHHQHLDRLARHQQTRQVLEADVVHGTVAAQADHGRAQQPFVVIELLPVKALEEFTVALDDEVTTQFHVGHAHGLEAFGHLGHVALEQAHGHRRRVLEQV